MLLLIACVSAVKDDSGAPTDSASTEDSDSTTVAGVLSGLRWELPCIAQTTPELCTTSDTLTQSAVLTGDAGKTYVVTLRLRGVIEPKTYTGGTAGEGWNRDGTAAGDTANIYALAISEPAARYFVNSGTTRGGDELYAEAMDFTVAVSVAVGATVTLEADSIDALQIRNIDADGIPIVVEGIPPAPDSFDGQFVQMDVVSVTDG